MSTENKREKHNWKIENSETKARAQMGIFYSLSFCMIHVDGCVSWGKTQIHEKRDKKSEEKNRNSGAASKPAGARAVLLWRLNMIICRGHFHFTSIRHLLGEEHFDFQRIHIQLNAQIQMHNQIQMPN